MPFVILSGGWKSWEKSALPSTPDKLFFTFLKGVISMSSAIFTCGNDAYQVAKIIYAGPVSSIPEDRRRNGSTHSFKIVTGLGAVFSYFKDEETAKKSRGALGAMLEVVNPKSFKHGYNEFVDPKGIVSFSKVVQFKQPIDQYTHGFVVTIDTADEKSREVWMRYKSEDHAQKGRKALWAAVHGANGMSAKATTVSAPADAGGPKADTTPF
jgi:hypothetical protein